MGWFPIYPLREPGLQSEPPIPSRGLSINPMNSGSGSVLFEGTPLVVFKGEPKGEPLYYVFFFFIVFFFLGGGSVNALKSKARQNLRILL